MMLHHRFGLATSETESGKNGQFSPLQHFQVMQVLVSQWHRKKNRSLIMILSGGTPNNTGQNTTLFIHLVQQRSNIRNVDLVSDSTMKPNKARLAGYKY